MAIIAGGVAIINHRRGRRRLSIPDRVGPIELAAFVLVPALLPLVFGGQVTSALVTAGGNLALLLVIYLVVGVGLLSIRLPREVRELEHDVGADPALTSRQRFNVGLVMFVSQALQVVVVAILVGAFFVAFGALAITPHVVEVWIGEKPHAIAGHAALSVELLTVSSALAAFSGLYYAIAVLSDATYREEFLTDLQTSLHPTFADRARYLEARSAPVAS